MRSIKIILMALVAISIGACSGSDTYRGSWKATNTKGEHLEIVFGENDMSIIKDGETMNYEYSQNSVNVKNSVETYGIKLDDGRSLQIHFPIGDDESKGGILGAYGLPVYIISRTEYLHRKDVYGRL